MNFLPTLNTRLKIVLYKHTEAETAPAALLSTSLYTLSHDSESIKASKCDLPHELIGWGETMKKENATLECGHLCIPIIQTLLMPQSPTSIVYKCLI